MKHTRYTSIIAAMMLVASFIALPAFAEETDLELEGSATNTGTIDTPPQTQLPMPDPANRPGVRQPLNKGTKMPLPPQKLPLKKPLTGTTTPNDKNILPLRAPFLRNASNTSEMRDFAENRLEHLEKREEFTKKLIENRQEILKKLEEKRGEKVKKMAVHAENIINAILKHIERFEEASEKLSTKIDEVSARGIDVASAKNTLAEAELKLTEAKAFLVEAQTTADSTSGNSVAKDNAKELRESLKNAEKRMVEAHKKLQEAAKTLRENLKNTTASSTSN